MGTERREPWPGPDVPDLRHRHRRPRPPSRTPGDVLGRERGPHPISPLPKNFTEVGVFFTAAKPLRDRIIFSRHNLLSDPPFSRVDLISCRNLSIYLNAPLQNHAVRLFHYALNQGGLLFLGKAETIDQQREVFIDVHRDARIFRPVHDPARRHRVDAAALGSSSPAPRAVAPRGRSLKKSVEEDARDPLLRAFAPPALLVSDQDDVIYAIGDVDRFLSIREGLIGTKVAALIHDELRAELRALLFKSRRDPKRARGGTHRLGDQSFRLTVQRASTGDESANAVNSLVAFESVEVSGPPRGELADEERDVEHLRGVVTTLEKELSVTRDNLNAVVEELESANQELQLLNEELQSSNEELQSTNEELLTVNDELFEVEQELAPLRAEGA
jgi:two-component system CheB/CheR fusion protein